jgi:cytochrome b561
MSQADRLGDPRIISYLTLRKAVGYLGILLPFALAAGNWLIFSGGLQQSVSDYYYTGMRGVLVGGLCVIGAFLLAYHGYDRWDMLFTNAAGLGAVGVALFPTAPPHPSFRAMLAGYLHYGFGVVLFASLTVIALWLFRKTDPAREPTRLKQLRNRVYLICGVVMVVSLALAGIVSLPFAAALGPIDPVFWLETAAVVAFGASWLVKGQAILRDKHP